MTRAGMTREQAMGKTKIKTIDDSVKEEVSKKPKKKAVEEKLEVVPRLRSGQGSEKEENVIPGSEATHESPQKDSGQARMTEKKPQKPGKTKPRSKKYQEISKDLDRSKSYPIGEAVDMVKKLSYAKFNATLEAHINTKQTGIRGLVSLPYASGKKLRILAFPSAKQFGPELTAEGLTSEHKKELENEGVVFGDDSTLDNISKGKVDFDLIITVPEWMPKLAKVAKVLGPKGLMPNPKNGTISDPSADGLKKAVEGFQTGKTEYKTEPKAPVIHLGLGKLDQSTDELSQNIKTLLTTLGKSRVKKVSLSPTMGPSVKLDLSTI